MNTVLIVLGAVLLYFSGVVASYVFTVVYFYYRPRKTVHWFDPPPKDYMTNKRYKLKAAKLEGAGCFGFFLLSWAFFVAVFIAGCIFYLLTYIKSGCDRLVKYIIKY